jgi:hypothetical protein
MKMNERKALFAAPTIALIITTSAGWAEPSYIARTCVDEAGHFARCTIYSTDDGRTHVFYQFECAAADQFGRCPNDPECYDAKGVTSCTGKVAPATAHCIDFSATASSKPEEACRTHGGVSAWYAKQCVDEAGHVADCTVVQKAHGGTEAYYGECRAAGEFGRCPDDPFCHDAQGHGTRCTGKVIPATARCNDGTATASVAAEQACTAHGGVSAHY